MAGIICFATGVAMIVFDAFSPDYSADTVQLGFFLGTGSVLLGVQGLKMLEKWPGGG